jgi:hypothetical protein
VIEEIVTGLVSAYLVSILALFYWFAWLTPDRKRRYQFFGIGHAQRKLRILCSFLQVQPGGAHGMEPLRVGFTGPAIIRSEYLGAQALQACIETVQRRTGPNVAMDRWRRLAVTIDASPAHLADRERYADGTLILLGSKVYNRLTQKYLDDNDASFFMWTKAANGERTFVPRRGADANLPVRRRPAQGEDPLTVRTTQLAIIERHRDEEFGRWVFVVAGVGALATTGAAKYLAQNWRLLERKIRKGHLQPEFGLLLEFQNCAHDLDLTDDISNIPRPRVLRVTDSIMYSEPANGVLQL